MAIRILFLFLCTSILTTIITGKNPDKVIGGVNTSMLNYPFKVSVQYFGEHICGGYILTKHHISTAANCVLAELGVSYAGLLILSGTADVRNPGERGTFHEVRRIIYHPRYNPRLFSNDVAILSLSMPFRFHATCQAAFLDTFTSYGDKELRSNLFLVGYNRLSPSPVTMLHRIFLQIFKTRLCSYYYEFVNRRHLCALPVVPSSGLDWGDGGSPVILFKKVIGIVSVLAVDLKHPVVLTSVYHHKNWIKDMTTMY